MSAHLCYLALARSTVLAVALAATIFSAFGRMAVADEVITLNYARASGGATVSQSYILIHDADPAFVIERPAATLLMFIGGFGRLRAGDEQLSVDATNFLLRSRHLFAAAGRFNVAVMDAASDFLDSSLFPDGLRGQRTSPQYLEDMQRVIADLRTRFPGLPVWAIGTSRGSTAAAQVAAQLRPPQGPDGIVLTSSVTVARPGANSLLDVALENIEVPTLVTAHVGDTCTVTPPRDIHTRIVPRLRRSRHHVELFNGGPPPISTACNALSPHGYFGIEPKVVRFIAGWIAKKPPRWLPDGIPSIRSLHPPFAILPVKPFRQ